MLSPDEGRISNGSVKRVREAQGNEMRIGIARSPAVVGLAIGILATAMISGSCIGAERPDMAASVTAYREQWSKFESFLARVYGQKWSTARLSDKTASVVSWHTDAEAKLRTAEA